MSIIHDFVVAAPVVGARQIATGLRRACLPNCLMSSGLLEPKLAIHHIYKFMIKMELMVYRHPASIHVVLPKVTMNAATDGI